MERDTAMKKGFSLVELLVVIAIIGILAAVLMGTFSGGTESARAARCLSNLRNLAAGCQSASMARGRYVPAGSLEYFTMTTRGNRDVAIYNEHPGWISWNSRGAYKGDPTSSRAQASWNVSMYDSDKEARMYCITNGAIWKYVSANHDIYLCPSHVNKMKRLNPNWSYVMNAFFEWTPRPGTDIFDASDYGEEYGRLKRADRILLFAEIPFAGIGVEAKEETGPGEDCDCVLQYKGSRNSSANETIGFNHKVGKLTSANICFADGHVEKLTYPAQGLSESELQDLTQWLCEGTDVSFDGKKYQKLTVDNN